MSSQKNRYIRFCGLGMLVVVGALGWFKTPVSLKFGNDILKDLPTMFGYLVLVSLFVERAIEVFLSAWRSQEADELDLKIGNQKKRIEESIKPSDGQQGDAVPDRKAIKTLEDLEERRTIYSAKSRFIAQWLGLGIGILVSLVGVRVLGNIVDTSALTAKREGAFIVVDIMLTGAVLAGGSEAINKIMKIYNSFMNSTEKKT